MKSFASVRKLWKQRPFKPFRIVTDSGQRFDILSPDHIMVTETTIAVGTRKRDSDPEFDSFRLLGVLNVNSVESLGLKSQKP
jgi:hypothetical protein